MALTRLAKVEKQVETKIIRYLDMALMRLAKVEKRVETEMILC